MSKYSDQQYIDLEFWPTGEGESNHSIRVVKVRKEHVCACNPNHSIKSGEKALYEKCILEDEGWVGSYTCLPCLDEWIEEHT